LATIWDNVARTVYCHEKGTLPNTECILATIKDAPGDETKPVQGSREEFDILLKDNSSDKKKGYMQTDIAIILPCCE
jgi:hypothetical protein